MLKRRIIALVVISDNIAVQSIGFRQYLPLGRPEIAIEYLVRWGVDEIILVDISASRGERGPNNEMVRRVSMNCHVPLTVAGGIKSVRQIGELLASGADKVCINHAARSKPSFITDAASQYGNQCVVASIDVAMGKNNEPWVYDYLKSSLTDEKPTDQARWMQEAGAGEILLNSVERDGSYLGYDNELIASVLDATTIPIIAVGGAGIPAHFVESFSVTGISALAAANIFHFWEHSITVIKSQIDLDVPIRRETGFNYFEARTDPEGRLLKKHDNDLEQMLYVKINQEVI